MKIIATNSKAGRDYTILESLETGIALKGCEIKSIRQGSINISDSFARIENGEVFLYNAHINPYKQASYLNVDPLRPRKLLLHKKQINKLYGKVAQRGFSLVPLKIYLKEGRAKIELALVRGKRQYDKRQTIKKKEADMQMRRAMKAKKRYS